MKKAEDEKGSKAIRARTRTKRATRLNAEDEGMKKAGAERAAGLDAEDEE